MVSGCLEHILAIISDMESRYSDDLAELNAAVKSAEHSLSAISKAVSSVTLIILCNMMQRCAIINDATWDVNIYDFLLRISNLTGDFTSRDPLVDEYPSTSHGVQQWTPQDVIDDLIVRVSSFLS